MTVHQGKGNRLMQVYIGNLSRHISDMQFNDLVLPFGKPDSLSVARDASGRGKGYGLLEYSNPDHARAAIAGLHGKDIDGQILNASAASPADLPR
jgi:RNA recognition motif-containing protein